MSGAISGAVIRAVEKVGTQRIGCEELLVRIAKAKGAAV